MILGDHPQDDEPSEPQDRVQNASDSPQDAVRHIDHESIEWTGASKSATRSSGLAMGILTFAIAAMGIGLLWVGASSLLNAVSSTESSFATVTAVTFIRESNPERDDHYRVQIRLNDGTVETRRAHSWVGKKIDVGDSVRVERTRNGRVVKIEGGDYEISDRGPFSILLGLGTIAAGGWIVRISFLAFVGEDEDEGG